MMRTRYHPIEEGLWTDPKFDATADLPEAPGDERGFFAFLASNRFQRPSGIYRATDSELAAAYRWPEDRVRDVLNILHRRRLIVRDGSWMFLPGYLERQAKGPSLLRGAEKDVKGCLSEPILEAFSQRYPLFNQWLPDSRSTVGQRSGDSQPTSRARARSESPSPSPSPSEEEGGRRGEKKQDQGPKRPNPREADQGGAPSNGHEDRMSQLRTLLESNQQGDQEVLALAKQARYTETEIQQVQAEISGNGGQR